MFEGNHDVAALNSLITTTIDSVRGYEEAAENARGEQFRTLFRDLAQDRRQALGHLQDAVRQLGGTPEDDGSVKAAAHRTWLNLKDALTGDSDKQVIEEVERGEDYIKEKFELALRADNLSPAARTSIEEAFRSVREGHNRASQLKHRMEGTNL